MSNLIETKWIDHNKKYSDMAPYHGYTTNYIGFEMKPLNSKTAHLSPANIFFKRNEIQWNNVIIEAKRWFQRSKWNQTSIRHRQKKKKLRIKSQELLVWRKEKRNKIAKIFTIFFSFFLVSVLLSISPAYYY